MGLGLVLFGIGGAVSGGLLDAFNGGSSTSSSDAFKADLTRLNKRLAANPSDQAALAALARTQYQVAGTGDNYDSTTGQFTQNGVSSSRR